MERAIIAPCLIPIIQHWFVLIKYHSRPVYFFFMILTEIFFQWEVCAAHSK